jgi:hypothetical protein
MQSRPVLRAVRRGFRLLVRAVFNHRDAMSSEEDDQNLCGHRVSVVIRLRRAFAEFVLLSTEPFKRAAKEVLDVAPNFGVSGFPACGREVRVFLDEHLRDDLS